MKSLVMQSVSDNKIYKIMLYSNKKATDRSIVELIENVYNKIKDSGFPCYVFISACKTKSFKQDVYLQSCLMDESEHNEHKMKVMYLEDKRKKRKIEDLKIVIDFIETWLFNHNIDSKGNTEKSDSKGSKNSKSGSYIITGASLMEKGENVDKHIKKKLLTSILNKWEGSGINKPATALRQKDVIRFRVNYSIFASYTNGKCVIHVQPPSIQPAVGKQKGMSIEQATNEAKKVKEIIQKRIIQKISNIE